MNKSISGLRRNRDLLLQRFISAEAGVPEPDIAVPKETAA